MKNKIPIFLLVFILFFILKTWYSTSQLNDLSILLAPTNYLVEFILGQKSTYIEHSGYYFPTLNVLIDKTCSGFNFFLLTFSLFSILGVSKFTKYTQYVLILLSACILAYFLTVLVNNFRIYVSIFIEEGLLNSFFKKRQHFKVHYIIGTLTNLSFLIIFFFGSQKLLNSLNHE